MIDQIIETIKTQGLMAVAPLKLRGKSRAVINFLALMEDTSPFVKTDWEVYINIRRN